MPTYEVKGHWVKKYSRVAKKKKKSKI